MEKIIGIGDARKKDFRLSKRREGLQMLQLTGPHKPDRIIRASEGLSCDPIYLVFNNGKCDVVAFGREHKVPTIIGTIQEVNNPVHAV